MEDTMECKICKIEQPVSEFRKNYTEGPLEPWNLRQCKSCVHAGFVERYADPEKRQAMQHASRNWKQEHPEHHRRLAREYRLRHPEKILAQNKLNYAVRKGRVIRQPCEQCGATERVHAHHVSYEPEDWYNVNWLCFRCHKIKHTEGISS